MERNKTQGENKVSTLTKSITKPVKLQKAVDFKALVIKHFPHIEWGFSDNHELSATNLKTDGIAIRGKNQLYGKPDTIKNWFIDCAPSGSGKTIEEAIEDWKSRIITGIANYYEPRWEFDFEAIRKAKAGGEKTLRRLAPPGEFYRWNLYLLRMELGKDIPIPTDPYADLRKD